MTISSETPFSTFVATVRVLVAAARHFTQRGLLVAIIAPLMLVGCYLPDAFTIDLNVDQNGDYRLSYRGHLVQPTITEGLMNGSIDEDDEKKRVEIVLADLKRDSGVKQLTYQGNGIFNIVYERRSNIIRDKSYVFVRRNSRILEMFFRAESNTVEIRGGFVPDQYEERLNALGYQMTGKIEIRTTAGVRSHNAAEFLNTGGQNRLRWEIKSITDPVPNVIIG
ncbi:hypothetical protein TALK_07630 [Thalassospira alkalitolerans]|uniref:Uncharacterized protein n=1 Tax=Thalassospira alkalitolerans TaxID=1293890 RepID=A0A1Y2LD72_9PROT|nr:hypothetical protein TALK_07630 [Thalassospira alkalitolerans]